MTEDNKSKFIKEFNLNRQISKEREVFYKEIGNSISNVAKEFLKFGKEVEQATQQNLEQYFNGVQRKIDELNDTAEICRFLIAEKRKYASKVIQAEIRKEGYLGKDYQAAIDKIIDPLFKHWEYELEFEKKTSPAKKIVPDANISKSKDIKNEHPVEMIKSDQEPVEEKGILRSIEIVSNLPDGFAQIICEATKEEILYFFMILAKEKNSYNNDFYMKEDDIIEFVKKNFFVFNSPPTGKYFPLNLLPEQKGRLVYFMYQFHLKYDRKLANTKMNYVMLLINNFEVFKNDNPQTLITNMSESKKPKSAQNIIPTSKYFSS